MDAVGLGAEQALSSPGRWWKRGFSTPLYPPGAPSAGGLHVTPQQVGYWGKAVLAETPNSHLQGLQTALGDLLWISAKRKNGCYFHCLKNPGSQRKKETWSFPEDATLSAEVGWERVSSRMGDPRCTLGVGEFRGRSCALLIRMSLNLSELPLHFAWTCPLQPKPSFSDSVTSWWTLSLGIIPKPLNPFQKLFSPFTCSTILWGQKI